MHFGVSIVLFMTYFCAYIGFNDREGLIWDDLNPNNIPKYAYSYLQLLNRH